MLQKRKSRKQLKAEITSLKDELKCLSEKYEIVRDGKQFLRRELQVCEDVINTLRGELTEFHQNRYHEITKSIISFIDNVDRMIQNPMGIQPAVAEGMLLMRDSFLKELKTYGIEKYDTLFRAFDPKLHNAVGLCTDNNQIDSTIVNVVKEGYKLNGKIIRYADVIVSKRSEENSDGNNETIA